MWFSLGSPVSSANKTDCHDITEILLKVALKTLTHLCCQQLSFPNKLNIHCGVLIESKKSKKAYIIFVFFLKQEFFYH